MNKKYELLSEVIELLETYEEQSQGRSTSVMGFSVWLNQQMGYFNPAIAHAQRQVEGKQNYGETDQASVLTMLISYLYRYAKHYTKKALDNTRIGTLDEFGFLVTLLERDSLTKTELINLHLLEMTSGIEIIKRLVKQGLMDSFPDPDDGRSRRVRLTPEGRIAVFEAMGRMQQVSQIVAGDLSDGEQNTVMPILARLNDFHAIIHKQDRKSELGDILDKYIAPSDN